MFVYVCVCACILFSFAIQICTPFFPLEASETPYGSDAVTAGNHAIVATHQQVPYQVISATHTSYITIGGTRSEVKWADCCIVDFHHG